MHTLNNKNRLDNSSGIGQDNPNKAMQTASETKKTPWHLRFAPGDILRNGLIAAIAVVAVLTPSIEQADAASRKKRPPETNPPRSGVGDSIAGNFIYDAITGQRVSVTSAMSGTITAIPSINEINSFKRTETVSDYTLHWRRLTTGTTVDTKTQSEHGYSAGHKWTEYFDVDFDMVVDNPNYDPDAEPGELNSERYKIEDGGGGGSRNEYGDSYMTRGDMIKKYSTSEYGRVTDSWGDKHVQLTKKGTWIYYGKSEKIKCEHELVDTIVNTDGRLALGQEYHYGLKYRRVWLTYDPDEGDFVVKKTEKLKNLNSAIPGWKFSATSKSRRNLRFLRRKNMEIVEGPTALGQSRIYWKSRVEDGLFSAPRTIWERAQHDELKEKEKQENN